VELETDANSFDRLTQSSASSDDRYNSNARGTRRSQGESAGLPNAAAAASRNGLSRNRVDERISVMVSERTTTAEASRLVSGTIKASSYLRLANGSRTATTETKASATPKSDGE
jgi:hypothetical protein